MLGFVFTYILLYFRMYYIHPELIA